MTLQEAAKLTFTKNLVFEQSVEDIYGRLPEIPAGYEVEAFRFARSGETFLTTTDFKPYTASYLHDQPRLILKAVPTVLPKVYTAQVTSDQVYPGGYEIPEGYKFVAFRQPSGQETYICVSGGGFTDSILTGHFAAGPRIIVQKI